MVNDLADSWKSIVDFSRTIISLHHFVIRLFIIRSSSSSSVVVVGTKSIGGVIVDGGTALPHRLVL